MAALISFVPACAGGIPVIDIEEIDPQTVLASKSVKLYMIGQPPPSNFQYIDSINTLSEQNWSHHAPATKGNAIAQAKIICIQKGGNALMTVGFDVTESFRERRGTTYAEQHIVLSADVIKID